VAEPDVAQDLELGADAGVVGEEVDGVGDRQLERLRDVLAAVGDREGLAIVALTLAHAAGDPDVGQEVHLDPTQALAVAVLAAAALDVEGEARGPKAADSGLVGLGVERAQLGEHPGVGRGVAPRRATDRRLIDGDYSIAALEVEDRVVLEAPAAGPVESPRGLGQQGVVDQARFAGPADPGHAGHLRQRDRDVDVGEVVPARALDLDPVLLGFPSSGTAGWAIDAGAAGQV